MSFCAPLRWLYCIYSYTLFVIIMLLVFPFALVATLFGRVRGGNMVMWLCRVWADLWLGLSAIRFRFILKRPMTETPHIFVSNHISLSRRGYHSPRPTGSRFRPR